jgi:hypothetical protein
MAVLVFPVEIAENIQRLEKHLLQLTS